MTIAGIQDTWRDPAIGETLRTCSMVITDPNKIAAEVHDRMPVILEAKDFEQWERGNVKDAEAYRQERVAEMAGIETRQQLACEWRRFDFDSTDRSSGLQPR